MNQRMNLKENWFKKRFLIALPNLSLDAIWVLQMSLQFKRRRKF